MRTSTYSLGFNNSGNLPVRHGLHTPHDLQSAEFPRRAMEETEEERIYKSSRRLRICHDISRKQATSPLNVYPCSIPILSDHIPSPRYGF